jgi:hypothetical protein
MSPLGRDTAPAEPPEKPADLPPTRVDRWISAIQNHPLIAVLIVVGVIVIALGNFVDGVRKLLPDFRRADSRPDLTVCAIDLANSRVEICNRGNAPAPTEGVILAWSEGWYTKPGYNRMMNIGLLTHPSVSEPIRPHRMLPLVIKEIAQLDSSTQFMIDALQTLDESNEDNNCLDGHNRVVTCRSHQTKKMDPLFDPAKAKRIQL